MHIYISIRKKFKTQCNIFFSKNSLSPRTIWNVQTFFSCLSRFCKIPINNKQRITARIFQIK